MVYAVLVKIIENEDQTDIEALRIDAMGRFSPLITDLGNVPIGPCAQFPWDNMDPRLFSLDRWGDLESVGVIFDVTVSRSHLTGASLVFLLRAFMHGEAAREAPARWLGDSGKG